MTANRFTWGEGDLQAPPHEPEQHGSRLGREPGGVVQDGPTCQACGGRVVAGPLCEECYRSIDLAYERARDELDLLGDPQCE